MSRQEGHLDVNELRVILALERAVARLQYDNRLSQHLIFKGGFVLLKHYESQRLTRDADALAISISKDIFKEMASAALMHDLNDGLWYGDIHVYELGEQDKYGALRFDMAFQIGLPKPHKIQKLSRIHIDIGFSDQLLTTCTEKIMKPLFSISEPISWRVYSMEQIISEKLQTLLQRGNENSRAKDIYDLIYLLPKCMDIKQLLLTIRHTFKNRQTPMPDSFFESVNKIDVLTTLEYAWPGIKTAGTKPSFDDAWKTLLTYLKELDDH